jgi:hypothetical protein
VARAAIFSIRDQLQSRKAAEDHVQLLHKTMNLSNNPLRLSHLPVSATLQEARVAIFSIQAQTQVRKEKAKVVQVVRIKDKIKIKLKTKDNNRNKETRTMKKRPQNKSNNRLDHLLVLAMLQEARAASLLAGQIPRTMTEKRSIPSVGVMATRATKAKSILVALPIRLQPLNQAIPSMLIVPNPPFSPRMNPTTSLDLRVLCSRKATSSPLHKTMAQLTRPFELVLPVIARIKPRMILAEVTLLLLIPLRVLPMLQEANPQAISSVAGLKNSVCM